MITHEPDWQTVERRFSLLAAFIIAKKELVEAHGKLNDVQVSLAEDGRTMMIYCNWNGADTTCTSFEMPEPVKDFDAGRWREFLEEHHSVEQAEWLQDYRGRIQ